ncbi:hypothetical protein [Pseudomonas sp. PH1b]|uniref:hypothetical protein n=1 Tax=Pseudomonas sp. PH1b TaxID=1397282 RepID=UPI0012FEA4CA|nr:hypothetical protein [Pseudomonas sp. PH1b]
MRPGTIASPFWFENTRQSWQSATQLGLKRLFQGSNASFRSLGLVFAFSPHQRLTRARISGPALNRLASKEVNVYP